MEVIVESLLMYIIFEKYGILKKKIFELSKKKKQFFLLSIKKLKVN